MLAFIAFFFPAVLSVCIFEHLANRELGIKNLVYRFCTNALLINFLCLLIKKYVFGTIADPLLYSFDMLPSVAFNYMILAVPISVLVAYIELYFGKKVKVSVKEDGNGDEEKTED